MQVVLSEEAGPRVLQIDPTKALKSQETEATLAVGHRLWPKKNNQRKFRSQTSDNMDRLKAEIGRVKEEKRTWRAPGTYRLIS